MPLPIPGGRPQSLDNISTPARRVALLLQTLPRHDACLQAHTRRWHWSDPDPTHVRIPSPPRSRPRLSEPAATFSIGYAPSGNGSWAPGAELQNGSVFTHRQVIGALALKCLGSSLVPPNRTRSHLGQCLHRQEREVSK